MSGPSSTLLTSAQAPALLRSLLTPVQDAYFSARRHTSSLARASLLLAPDVALALALAHLDVLPTLKDEEGLTPLLFSLLDALPTHDSPSDLAAMIFRVLPPEPDETLHTRLLALPYAPSIVLRSSALFTPLALERAPEGFISSILTCTEDSYILSIFVSQVIQRAEASATLPLLLALPVASLKDYSSRIVSSLDLHAAALAVAAQALEGDFAAQEIFWTLAESWTGSLSSLLHTSLTA